VTDSAASGFGRGALLLFFPPKDTPMLADLTCAVFTLAVNQIFRVTDSEGNGVDLELIEAKEHPNYFASSITHRTPFNLAFRRPSAPAIPQGIYMVEHPVLGRFEGLLIAPLFHPSAPGGPDTRHYQISFG